MTKSQLTQRAPDGGSLRVFKQFVWLEAGPGNVALSHPPTRGNAHVSRLVQWNKSRSRRWNVKIAVAQPEYLIEDWPGKYDVFSWLEYIVTVPNPIFFITTRKPNGAPNANLNSWGFLIGEKDNYSSLIALLNNSHTYQNILREGEWCVGFPSFQHYRQCFETIRLNAQDNDEITEAGFTVELPKSVQAPRIAECSINLECRLAWHHPLYENSRWHLSQDESYIWLWMKLWWYLIRLSECGSWSWCTIFGAPFIPWRGAVRPKHSRVTEQSGRYIR